MTSYRALVPLWGMAHALTFAEVVLPSLLQPGNLPFLSAKADTALLIICPVDAAEVIKASESFLYASGRIRIKFLLQKPVESDGYEHNYHRATRYYLKGMAELDVRPGETAFVFLTPDGLYGDGSFKAMHARCQEGYKAVMIPGPRVVQESFLPEYQRRTGTDPATFAISNRELAQLFFRHVHRISQSRFIDGERRLFNAEPAHMYWEVPGEGILSHSFVNHPLMVKPDRRIFEFRGTIDQILVPLSVTSVDEVYICRDSDEIFGIDLAPYHYDQGSVLYSRHSIEKKRARIRKWICRGWVTAFHLWQATQPSRILNSDPGSQWVPVEKAAKEFVAEVFDQAHYQREFMSQGAFIRLLDPWVLTRKYGNDIPPIPMSLKDRILNSAPIRLAKALRR